MSRRTIDLGQLHLTVHALLGDYRERPSAFIRSTVHEHLALRLRVIEKQLAHLDEHDPLLGLRTRLLEQTRDRVERQLDTHHHHRRRPAGLLEQLVRPLPYRPSDDAGPVNTGKSGSRPPATLLHLDLLAKIETGVIGHDCDLRDALDQHRYQDWPWQRMLWALPTLADQLGADHALVRKLDRDLRSWHSSARVLLGYIAPMVTLTTPCPHCGEQSMIVREDATSDVVCTTAECIDPKTEEQSRWPRTAWQQLLAGRYASGVVNTDAAALHLGVAAATLRDWKRRGLITPAGGTTRYPLWALADLVTPTGRPATRQDLADARCSCGHTPFAHAERADRCQRQDCDCTAFVEQQQEQSA
jgi:hypothetical protein